MRASIAYGAIWLSLLLVSSALAQTPAPGECTGGLCGNPDESGGGCGCGCGCGSILIANTDLGDTYQYADDYDEDGVEDDFDNCAYVANRDQADKDGDGVGDACDNCASLSNRDQHDTDGDQLGDACDPDLDQDTILNADDNCPAAPNVTQEDVDDDLLGDACDPDIDDDGFENPIDNCPFVYNPDQQIDPNSAAACTKDLDGDGLQDFDDNCPLLANFDQVDTDADGMGDACDADDDGDRVPDEIDDCPRLANEDQTDSDRDGAGDACDVNGFCYVVDSIDRCLDPTAPFEVHGGSNKVVKTGAAVALLLWANRENRAIDYEWTVVSRPDGSTVGIRYPKGSSNLSTPYNYHYKKGRRVEFTADMPGDYTFRVTARLLFRDDLYPDKLTASAQVSLKATGSPQGGGCATAAGSSVTGLLLLVLGAARGLRARREH